MSKKSILMIAVAVVATLVVVSTILPPLPRAKKHGTRIQVVNSLPIISFALTNDIATNRLPASKP